MFLIRTYFCYENVWKSFGNSVIATFLTLPEGNTSGMRVGVAMRATTQRHHSWVSCLRGKHGGRLPTRRQHLVTRVEVFGSELEARRELFYRYFFGFPSLIFRMKQFPFCFSHRDRGDGRRGEAKEAGGRQSKGKILSFWC